MISDVRARACDKACHKPWKARFCYGHNYNWNQNLVTYLGLETKYDFLGRKKTQNFQLGYFIFVTFLKFNLRFKFKSQLHFRNLFPFLCRVTGDRAKAIGLFRACDGLVTKPEPAHH